MPTGAQALPFPTGSERYGFVRARGIEASLPTVRNRFTLCVVFLTACGSSKATFDARPPAAAPADASMIDGIGWRPNSDVRSEVESDGPSPIDASAREVPNDAVDDRPVGQIVTVVPLCYGIFNGEDSRGCMNDRRCDATGTCVSRFTEFTVPTPRAGPEQITRGPDGNLWFTTAVDKIGRITAAGEITEFAAKAAFGITTGPDGSLWFTPSYTSTIGRMTVNGDVTIFPFPGPGSGFGIVGGSDGNIWFAVTVQGSIGRMTPAGQVTMFPTPTPNSFPLGVTSGPDGNVWFAEQTAAKIGRITPAGVVTEFATPIAPSSGAVRSIVVGPDANLWFTAPSKDQIGRITVDGTVKLFDLPRLNLGRTRNPSAIVTGPDGQLWFTQYLVSAIGRISTEGAFSQWAIPSVESTPTGIVVGPDGAIWFAEKAANRIGRFHVD